MLKICLQCHKEFNVKYDKRRKFCRPGCAPDYLPQAIKHVATPTSAANIAVNSGMKQCRKCKEIKDIKLFMKRKDSKDGFRNWCRRCMQDNVEECREKDPEKYKEVRKKSYKKHAVKRKIGVKAWDAANPDKVKNKRLRIYKINFEQYNNLLFKQNDSCALCKRHKSEFKKDLYIDHCHKTGRIRGLLCQKCNSGLGFLNDDPALCQAAVTYLNSDHINIHEEVSGNRKTIT